MARVETKTARKEYRCMRGDTIKVGEKYYSYAPGFRGATRRNCVRHYPKPSETTGNEKLATLYSAIEDAQDRLSAWEANPETDATEYKSIVEDTVNSIQEVVEMYEESAQNIEDGFQHETSQSEELRDTASQLEDFRASVEAAGDQIEAWDEEAERTEIADTLNENDSDDAAERVLARLDEKRKEWAAEAAGIIQQALEENPL